MADAWGGSWGNSWGVSWGAGFTPQPEPETTARRGTGGWGAGLNARRRNISGQPIPLSQRDRKLSELDPVIVKASVSTPATVLAPLISDDDDLMDILELEEMGLLN